jgi:hypothetical protein
MTILNSIPKQRWFSMEETIALIPENQYSETVYGREKLPPELQSRLNHQSAAPIDGNALSKRHRVFGGQTLLDTTVCHEYLALDLNSSNLKDLKRHDAEKASRRTVVREFRSVRQHGFYPGAYAMPSFMMLPSYWWAIYIKSVVAGMVIFMPIMLISIILMSFYVDGFMPVLKGLFFIGEDPHWIIWGLLGFIPLLKVIDYIEKRGWHQLLDPKEVPLHSVIQRTTGMIRIFNNKREWADLPFEEFEGLNTLVPAGRGLQIRKLTLHHKKTGSGFLIGDGTTGGWYTGLNWEYYRHYMDVSRPLPDIPFWEPYRHLDPTTKAWDEKHNRPERLWRDMDEETYEKMVEASITAAKKYPYLKPEKAKEEGWQPAGDGKNWYQLG